MQELFGFAGGSVVGRSHRLAGKNNQDACCCLCEKEWTIAVVCDGCSSGEHSEVGAQIGARLIAQMLAGAIRRELHRGKPEDSSHGDMEALLEHVRRSVLMRLLPLAKSMGGSLSWTINNYFLFTVVGALLTPSGGIFFSLGDGVIVVNEEVIVLGPFPANAPPYLGYGLLEGNRTGQPDSLCFQVNRVLALRELRSFLIGTDGVQDLMKAASRPLPGKVESVGSLKQFWRDEHYFLNPDMVRRRLAGINRDVATCVDGSMRKEAGLLTDDTTLIVGRRRITEEKGGAK